MPSPKLKRADLVGVSKYLYLIWEKQPAESDSRFKAMDVYKKPAETCADIGGLHKQIQEPVEAVVLSLTQRFNSVGLL